MCDRLVDRHHVLSIAVVINSEPPTVCLQRLTVGMGATRGTLPTHACTPVSSICSTASVVPGA